MSFRIPYSSITYLFSPFSWRFSLAASRKGVWDATNITTKQFSNIFAVYWPQKSPLPLLRVSHCAKCWIKLKGNAFSVFLAPKLKICVNYLCRPSIRLQQITCDWMQCANINKLKNKRLVLKAWQTTIGIVRLESFIMF